MARESLRQLLGLVKAEDKGDLASAFLTDLTYSIEYVEVNPSDRPSQTYKPSFMNCLRGMYYMRTGAQPNLAGKKDACSEGIAESGTDRHIRIQQAICNMKNRGIDCEYIDVETFIKQRDIKGLRVVSKSGMETKCFYEPLQMSFMTDGIIKYRGIYFILEIKTETSMKWNARKGVDEKHRNQGCCYSYIFGIPRILWLYEGRDLCNKKVYLMETTEQEIKERVLDKIATCEDYVKKGIVPPKPEHPRCNYCQYTEICRSGEQRKTV